MTEDETKIITRLYRYRTADTVTSLRAEINDDEDVASEVLVRRFSRLGIV